MENLKIYIDRLKGGHTHKIEETLPPEFMDLDDDELLFEEPIHVSGDAYLADDHLIIHLNITTSALLPCSICNDAVETPIAIKNIYLTEPLAEIKGAIYDCAEQVRETILLQTPLFTECNNGKCPERESIKKFLKPEEKPSAPGDIVHFPFADLDK
ncbi:MAG: hypothetical protein JSS60_09420 [Verrucomicrobia bacterium]|nr:hypothetical protein [Verrucomicrobiota bacterium]